MDQGQTQPFDPPLLLNQRWVWSTEVNQQTSVNATLDQTQQIDLPTSCQTDSADDLKQKKCKKIVVSNRFTIAWIANVGYAIPPWLCNASLPLRWFQHVTTAFVCTQRGPVTILKATWPLHPLAGPLLGNKCDLTTLWLFSFCFFSIHFFGTVVIIGFFSWPLTQAVLNFLSTSTGKGASSSLITAWFTSLDLTAFFYDRGSRSIVAFTPVLNPAPITLLNRMFIGSDVTAPRKELKGQDFSAPYFRQGTCTSTSTWCNFLNIFWCWHVQFSFLTAIHVLINHFWIEFNWNKDKWRSDL